MIFYIFVGGAKSFACWTMIFASSSPDRVWIKWNWFFVKLNGQIKKITFSPFMQLMGYPICIKIFRKSIGSDQNVDKFRMKFAYRNKNRHTKGILSSALFQIHIGIWSQHKEEIFSVCNFTSLLRFYCQIIFSKKLLS